MTDTDSPTAKRSPWAAIVVGVGVALVVWIAGVEAATLVVCLNILLILLEGDA